MIMRLDFEGAGPAVANVDNSRILTRSLQDSSAARRQALEMHTRRFVGAVLAPHHAENAKFGNGRLAAAEKLFDLLVLVEGEAVLPERLRRKCRAEGSSHVKEILLSHFIGAGG